MKRIIFLTVMVAAVATLSAAPAFAQFGDLMKKKDGGGSDSGTSQKDVELQQEQLVKRYIAAQSELSHAQSLMLGALGAKKKSAEAEAVAKDLAGEAMSKKVMEKSSQNTAENTKEINKLKGETVEFSAEAKAQFGKSLIPYAKSVANTAAMVGDAKNLATGIQAQIKAAGMMGAMKVKKTFDMGLYLAPKIPKLSGGQIAQLGDLVEFAKKHGIKVDDSVTASAKIPPPKS